jgi:hypothetical protein
MMNAWLQSQTQKQQQSTRSFELQRQGMAITEQLNAQEEKFAKANRHILSEMVKRYGSDKGTQLFYSSVREQVKKINEDTSTSRGEPYGEPPTERPTHKKKINNPPPAQPLSPDPRNDAPPPAQPLSTSQGDSNVVPTSQNERSTPGGVGVPSDIPMPYTSGRKESNKNLGGLAVSYGLETTDDLRARSQSVNVGGISDSRKMSSGNKRPQPAPQPAPQPPRSNPYPYKNN